MSSNLIFAILLATSSFLFTLVLVVTILNIIKRRAMLKAIEQAQQEITNKIQASSNELLPLFEQFFPKESEKEIEKIKTQLLDFYNKLMSLLIDCQPKSIEFLPGLITTLNSVYVDNYLALAGVVNAARETTALTEDTEAKLREAVVELSNFVGEDTLITEKDLNLPAFLAKLLTLMAEKSKTKIQQEIGEEDVKQYSDLIEQLRHEKKDLSEKNKEMQKTLELIYAKYQDKLGISSEKPVNDMDNRELLQLFDVE